MANQDYRHKCLKCKKYRSHSFHQRHLEHPIVEGICRRCRPPGAPEVNHIYYYYPLLYISQSGYDIFAPVSSNYTSRSPTSSIYFNGRFSAQTAHEMPAIGCEKHKSAKIAPQSLYELPG
ncbi:hypothetical protein V8C42DRAFT_338085 [Trichoderma barbatum]